jgi:hypothetical protein
MKNKTNIIIGIVVLLLLGTGGLVVKVLTSGGQAPKSVVKDEEVVAPLPMVDSSVVVDVVRSPTKDNTVIMKVSGLDSRMQSVAYELTYESQGLIKGVNSGSKPIDTSGKDAFDREIYFGTCSRNVCKPDVGVKKVSVVLEFTDTAGKKSQFSKDFDL